MKMLATRLDKRFHELVVKHALRTATEDDMRKLEILQRLRRTRIGADELSRRGELAFLRTQFALKMLTFVMRRSIHLPSTKPKRFQFWYK